MSVCVTVSLHIYKYHLFFSVINMLTSILNLSCVSSCWYDEHSVLPPADVEGYFLSPGAEHAFSLAVSFSLCGAFKCNFFNGVTHTCLN